MNELESKVVEWAKARGIYNGERDETRFRTQLFKLLSEVGELADAYIKNDKEALKDAIGDCAVVLTSLVRLAYKSTTIVDTMQMVKINALTTDSAISFIVEHLSVLFIREYFEDYKLNFSAIINFLSNIAEYNGFTLEECYYSAYEVIKNRTGKTTADGNFIKDN